MVRAFIPSAPVRCRRRLKSWPIRAGVFRRLAYRWRWQAPGCPYLAFYGIEARGVQLQQLQQMPAMLHAVRLDMTRYELLDGALRSEGYAARQVLDLG